LIVIFPLFIFGFTVGIIGEPNWDWERVTFILLISFGIFIVITGSEHYLEDHIWKHIVKKHIWRVFLWTFFALLVVDMVLKFWNIKAFVNTHMFWILLITTLIGIVPESGLHLIFVMMYAQGIIPFLSCGLIL